MAERSKEEREDLVRRADAGYRGFPDFAAWVPTPVDDEAWSSALASFDQEKRKASRDALQHALDYALRAAAVDTGAIEGLYQVDRGFTYSVAAQAATWESDIAEKGPLVRRLFEAQLAGLELVVDAVTRKTEISEAWLRTLHQELCREQATYRVWTSHGYREQALPKGVYKKHPNHVRLTDGEIHSYSPVDLTPAEMHRLFNESRSAAFAKAHPVVQAAFAHYALVAVHPFADGNGRVARALASVFTYRATSIPLVVYADQKSRYLEALSHADSGRLESFIRFVLHAAVDTLNELSLRLKAARANSVRESVGRIEQLYARSGTLTAQEIDAAASRVAIVLRDEIDRQLADARKSGHVACTVKLEKSLVRASGDEFRPVKDGGASVTVTLGSAPPAQAGFATRFHVVVARRVGAPFDLQVERVGGGNADPLPLRLDQVFPAQSTSFRSLLDAWVRIHLSELLSELERRAVAALPVARS